MSASIAGFSWIGVALLAAAVEGNPPASPVPVEAAPAVMEKASPEGAARGRGLLRDLVSASWAEGWRGAELQPAKLAAPRAGQTFPTGLPAVWHAGILRSGIEAGYLMWETGAAGALVEFSLQDPDGLKMDPPEGRALNGIRAIQQFAVTEPDGRLVASGCVPTAGAAVLEFWIRNGFLQWRGEAGAEPGMKLALRLRARLDMQSIPDRDGFTENGMNLAGAWPEALAKAIREDAAQHLVRVDCGFGKFSRSKVREEIGAGRPVLLSCKVRVPFRPELSWNHEVAGVGWLVSGETAFCGVADNFYPAAASGAIRWIREDAFDSLITVRPVPDP